MRCCFLLVVVGLVAVLAGCARTEDTRTTVRFWVMGYEGEVVAKLLPEFERQHPDIHVDLQIVPWLSAHEKLLTAFAGDSLPDVCPIGNTWIPEFAALGALDPLDDEIAATAGFDAPDFFPGVWDTGVIDGRAYAVPWYVETRLPFYRRDVLAKAGVKTLPTSWAEWRIALRKVKQVAGEGNYSILLPLNEFEPLLSLAIQQPEPLLRDGGRYGNFRSEGFRQSLGFYKEMFDQGWAPVVTNNQISNVWDEFGKGFYSFYISGPWNIAKFKEQLGGKIYGIEPGNDGNRLILGMIGDNKFDLGSFELVESSEQGMLAQVDRATRRKQPIVFLGWEPHPMNAKYQMSYLEGGDEVFGPNYGGATVFTNVREGYLAECPNVGKLIANLKFTLPLENELMGAILFDGTDASQAAETWLKANLQQAGPWLAGVTSVDGKPGMEALKASLGE